MKNLFVPYNLSIKLKEKGFDEPCFGTYNSFGNFMFQDADGFSKNSEKSYDEKWIEAIKEYGHTPAMLCTAPIFQQVTDWFREKHNISIEVTHNVYKNVIEKFGKYSYDIKYVDDNPIKKADLYGFGTNDYYETLRMAIESTIKEI